ncbi:2'-5' RNA ligase [Arthrobacter pigmenti]|uniref:2'-5' RNA ligase n=1 Tax=Arthrobacter pigmenti TaxID=271432 RepID=A0A846RU64_9MICC|nr:2'-5' RNA ligase family protein [Arthrobacter pigmenti]NJC24072.1 2'-5' RNA ligase [Arthrobacter pigmenti]
MDSIEILPDPHAEELIRRDWARLQDSDLPSQARHTAASNRPHITLLAAPAVPDHFDPALQGLNETLPIGAHTAGLMVFRTGRGLVLARAVVVGVALLELHRKVHQALADVPKIAENSVPGRWIPHLTLARGLSPDQLARAVEILPPDHGSITLAGLRRWDSHQRTTTALASR